jgi:hypothetical protein
VWYLLQIAFVIQKGANHSHDLQNKIIARIFTTLKKVEEEQKDDEEDASEEETYVTNL